MRYTPHFYAGNQFDRLAERREDAAWLRAQLESRRTRLLLTSQGKLLVQQAELPSLQLVDAVALAEQLGSLSQSESAPPEWILLGEFRGEVCFALEVSEPVTLALPQQAEFLDLRHIGNLMTRDEAGLSGYARALSLWHARHRFCGQCGTATHSIKAGHARQCSNSACNLQHFPRLDPAIIVLITDGPRVLLGRQGRWPADRYSTIAGFVEWGESLEEAVAREVLEETGVHVADVLYHSSQPWPFPSSLMLGFIAHACTTEVHCRDGELADARWLSRDDLRNGAVTLPPPHAISLALIEAWYNRDSACPLQQEPGVRIANFSSPPR